MKKILALFLTLCLLFMLSACGGAASNSEGGNLANYEGGEIDFNKDDLPTFKIAFGYGQWESVLGSEFKASIEYLCEAFNCEPIFFNSGRGEEAVAAVESLLAAGDIDGIISANWDTARMVVADKYGVPVITACQAPSGQEAESVAAYDLYLGGVTDSEVWAGYQAMKSLYDAGCRNVTYSGLTPGYAKGHDDRTAGAMQFIAEHPDMNLLTESYTTALWDEDVPTFVASFPEMDGMCFTALNDAVYNAMETEGIADGSVKVAGPDVSSMTGNYFQAGVQVWTCGGQYATAMIAWAILYNYLIDGTVIISDSLTPLERNYLEIGSYEEFQHYQEFVNSPQPVYSAQEIAELIHFFNPEVTINDYIALGEQYTLEDIIARRGN